MTDKTKEARDYGRIPEMAWIDIDLLRVNDKYQRDTKSKRSRDNIEKIMMAFNWADFTPITVSKEENGYYSIIDGQHRFEAAAALGDISQLPCWIVVAKTSKQAQNFIDINQNRVGVTPYAIYKAQLCAGEPWAVEIEKFCNSVGIIIPFNGYCSLPNMTIALSTIRSHLKANNNGYLSEAIKIIRTAFPDKNNQLKADIINTLVDLKIEYGSKIKNDDLVSALRAFDDVDRITAKGRELHALDATLKPRAAHKKVFVAKIKEIRRAK